MVKNPDLLQTSSSHDRWGGGAGDKSARSCGRDVERVAGGGRPLGRGRVEGGGCARLDGGGCGCERGRRNGGGVGGGVGACVNSRRRVRGCCGDGRQGVSIVS